MKRPFPVTFLGWLFIVVGLGSLIYHLSHSTLDRWIVPISAVGIIAIVGGLFLLRGAAWSRWLLLAWLAVHVGISVFRSLSSSLAHLVLLLVIGYFLLGPPSSNYFKSRQSPHLPHW
jgi:hypothetical protein